MNATQLEFKSCAGGASQCDRILHRLKETPDQWVPMPELVRVSGGYAVHSRIADLRKRGPAEGFSIDHKNESGADGKIHSFYRLTYYDVP